MPQADIEKQGKIVFAQQTFISLKTNLNMKALLAVPKKFKQKALQINVQ